MGLALIATPVTLTAIAIMENQAASRQPSLQQHGDRGERQQREQHGDPDLLQQEDREQPQMITIIIPLPWLLLQEDQEELQLNLPHGGPHGVHGQGPGQGTAWRTTLLTTATTSTTSGTTCSVTACAA